MSKAQTRKSADWLQSFVDYASYGEAPLKTLFWTGVSTVAGALRRQVWIDQKYFQWSPCFYIILVAPPGIVSKSTTANIGINLLRELPEIQFGPDVVTWQKLVASMAKATTTVKDPATLLDHRMSAITICSDEFGTFLDPTDKGMVDALTSLWDGKKGTFSKETKSAGNDAVENPWVNIIACTTPGWIAGNFPEYMVGGGFTSRCIFVYAEQKRQLVAYPGLSAPHDFEQQKADLIHDLKIISKLVGEYKLTPEAVEWGEIWYKEHWKARPAHLNNERFGGYLARKQTHMHKLAIVLAASRGSSLLITPDHLQFSNDMIDTLERDMPRVFSTIGQNTSTRGMATLVNIVLQRREIYQTELYQELFSTMTSKEFLEALASAALAGFLETFMKGNRICIRALKAAPDTSEPGNL